MVCPDKFGLWQATQASFTRAVLDPLPAHEKGHSDVLRGLEPSYRNRLQQGGTHQEEVHGHQKN